MAAALGRTVAQMRGVCCGTHRVSSYFAQRARALCSVTSASPSRPRPASTGRTCMPQPSGVRSMSTQHYNDIPSAAVGATSILGMDLNGFNVNNVDMRGSIICTPTTTMLWDCQGADQITTAKLAVVALVKPRIEFLIIGTGEHLQFVDVSVFPFFQKRGISVECMTTSHAIATFNLLNAEGRGVAAALLSRNPLSRAEMCAYTSGFAPPEAD